MRGERALRVGVSAVFVAAIIGLLFGKRSAPAPLAPGWWHAPMTLSYALWLTLAAVWAIAGRSASAARTTEPAASRGVHLALVLVALVLSYWPFTGWPTLATPAIEFPRILPDSPLVPAIGFLLAVSGFGLAVWARLELGRQWSAVVTTKVDHELVRGGPYRWLRHPIYTGVLAMYAATAFFSARLQGALAIALILIAYDRKSRLEERVMEAEFGATYSAYRRTTWGLIPGFGRGGPSSP